MILILCAILVVGPLRPDPALTPGAVRALSLQTICTTRWGVDRRRVSDATRREVFRRYGVPWAKRALYEVDHLVPRSEGGADLVANLWPQPWDGPLGAHAKDRVEGRLHRDVCAGRLPLETAREQMRAWGTP